MTAPLHALKSLKNSLHNAFAIQELLECVRRPTPSDNMDMLRHRRHRARHLSVAKWCCHAPGAAKKQWIRESHISLIGVRLFTFRLFSQQVVRGIQCQCIVRYLANDGRRPPQDNGFDVARSRLNWTDVNPKVIVQMTAPLHALKNALHNAFAIQELLECVRRPAPSDNMDMLRHRRHRARHLSVAKWCCHAPGAAKKQWIRESHISLIGVRLFTFPLFSQQLVRAIQCQCIVRYCANDGRRPPQDNGFDVARSRLNWADVNPKMIVQMTAPLHALKSLKNALHNAFAIQELLECVRRPAPSDNMDMLRHRRHRARHLSVAKWCCHVPETSKKQWIREKHISSIGVRLFTFRLFSQQVVRGIQCQCIVRYCANDGRRPPQDNGFDVARSRLNWADVNLKW